MLTFTLPKGVARLFLDTEFTGFSEPQLLSIALVLDERHYFYGELNVPAHTYEKNDFVDEHVLSQWGKVPTTFESRADLTQALSLWLRGLGANSIEVHYDYHTDMDLLEELLMEAGLWETWKRTLVPTHVAYLYGDDRVESFMLRHWVLEEAQTGLKPHHALVDAHVLRHAFLMVHDGVGA